MNVHIITIGDEILIGQIIDTNSAWMAQQLNLQGMKIAQISSVSDSETGIWEGVTQAEKNADIILLTGGLGPTKDDITKKVLAKYFNTSLVFNEELFERISQMLSRVNVKVTDAHKEQCFMPESATLLTNNMGTAPGMWFEKDGKVFVSMPGVPYEMKNIMEFQVLPRLRERFNGTPIAHRTVMTGGIGESDLAQRIADFENNLPDNISLAYLPSLGRVRLRLSAIGQGLETTLNEKVAELDQLIPEYIFGYEVDTLEEVIGKLLKERGQTIATFESCTGGAIAKQITAISGCSAYFKGSVVAYANEAKQNILGVKTETLENHGAVSEATVIEMVKGGIKLLNTDFGIAISGIAGPTGGTEEKPVGTIWIAVGNKDKVITKKLGGTKHRSKNIERSTAHALFIFYKFLKNL